MQRESTLPLALYRGRFYNSHHTTISLRMGMNLSQTQRPRCCTWRYCVFRVIEVTLQCPRRAREQAVLTSGGTTMRLVPPLFIPRIPSSKPLMARFASPTWEKKINNRIVPISPLSSTFSLSLCHLGSCLLPAFTVSNIYFVDLCRGAEDPDPILTSSHCQSIDNEHFRRSPHVQCNCQTLAYTNGGIGTSSLPT